MQNKGIFVSIFLRKWETREATREDILALLEDIGEIPDRLRNKVSAIATLVDLKILHKIAARADSFPAFEEEMDNYLHSREEHE